MSRLVTIYGGAGFAGRYIARRMAKSGWRVRVATRDPNEAMEVRTYGVVGQVSPILCNIRDEDSTRAAMRGADVVINCVGLTGEKRKNTFDAVQAEGAERVARLADEEGVGHLVHFSAICADSESASGYARTKAEGEAAVLAHMPGAAIIRPSVIFGTEDKFFNSFATLARFTWVLPVVQAERLYQPVYVDDVAAAAAALAASGQGGTYELGGPEVKSLRELLGDLATVTRRRRLVINLPGLFGRLTAGMGDFASWISLGIIPSPISRDRLKAMTADNVVSDEALSFADLGIEPTPMANILPDYLWRFRPSGQFMAIKDSAQNLRNT
ncbi:MAG: complex I NDUFA9 subunit family protein [Rhodobacteraceae bacterium]|nr:complex I NDUFA9 subunit family protein [Paracoccaceae bacterium]